MKITVNGQIRDFEGPPSLESVVSRFCRDKNPVIAELNGNIIRNPDWQQTAVNEGDTIELVSFVGGGA